MDSVGQQILFPEWLRSEMDKRGWSQSDLARTAELNRAVINKLLNGKSQPQPATLEAISRALKLPLEMVYRTAGLLPAKVENDTAAEEALYLFKSIQSTQRRATAITLLKALITEEEDELKANHGKR